MDGIKRLVLRFSTQDWNDYWFTDGPYNTHHSDSIIQQWFSKYQDVQQLVDVDLLKDSQHSNRVYSRNDGAKQQAREQFQLVEFGWIVRLDLAHSVEQTAYKKSIPQGAHNSKHEDCPQVLHERTDGQEVASIQDDWRQQAEEEQPGVQHWGNRFSRQFDEPPHQQANHNQKTALWHNTGQLRNQVEPWENGKRSRDEDTKNKRRMNGKMIALSSTGIVTTCMEYLTVYSD